MEIEKITGRKLRARAIKEVLTSIENDPVRRVLFLSKIWYNKNMYNWSVDESKLKKNKEKHSIWELEQMVNFGLGGKKLKKEELKKYWDKLHIDPARKRFLSLLLDAKRDTH